MLVAPSVCRLEPNESNTETACTAELLWSPHLEALSAWHSNLSGPRIWGLLCYGSTPFLLSCCCPLSATAAVTPADLISTGAKSQKTKLRAAHTQDADILYLNLADPPPSIPKVGWRTTTSKVARGTAVRPTRWCAGHALSLPAGVWSGGGGR